MKELRDVKIDPAKLRKARLAAFPEASQTRVAAMLSIHKQSLSDYENGATRPTSDRLAQMCLLYGVEIAELTDADSLDIKNLRKASVAA